LKHTLLKLSIVLLHGHVTYSKQCSFLHKSSLKGGTNLLRMATLSRSHVLGCKPDLPSSVHQIIAKSLNSQVVCVTLYLSNTVWIKFLLNSHLSAS
jgi:hypothetical protein